MKRILLPIAILVTGFGLAALIIATGPTLQQQAPPESSPLVRTWQAQPQSVTLKTLTHGTVLPRTEGDLVPEVSGRVTQVSDALVSGGFFRKGDLLLSIDPLDYEVAVEQAKAALASAQSEITSARRAHLRQLDLAKKQSTSESLRDDALNRYQFAQAAVREAKARLARAERDLARTRLYAPYDGRVRSEQVDIGQFVNRGAPIAKLYATDVAEVRLPLADEELAYLNLPLTGFTAPATTPEVSLSAQFAGRRHTWKGHIVRTEGEIDPQTRMINVIAQVLDPYARHAGKPPLAVGLFVDAEIRGTTVDNVYVMPRSAIQANNQLYVIEDDRIVFREVTILRYVGEDVYISDGVRAGELVCLSTINNAIEGMRVRPV